MWEDAFTIASNLAFLLPLYESICRQRWIRAVNYAAIVISSSAYHGCNSFGNACLGLPPDTLRHMDFFWAQLIIPLTALYTIEWWSDAWYAAETVLIFVAGFVLFIVQRYMGDSIYLQLVVSGASFGGIFAYWFLYAIRRCRKYDTSPSDPAASRRYLPKYRWEYFCGGIGLSGVAVALFAAEMLSHRHYWAVHSCWHVDAALAQVLMLNIWPAPKESIRLQGKHGKPGHRAVLNRPITTPPPLNTTTSQRFPLIAPTSRTTTHVTPKSRVIIVVNE